MPSGANPFVVNLYDLLICLTNAGDLISPEVTDHHQRVAYLAFRIGRAASAASQAEEGSDARRPPS